MELPKIKEKAQTPLDRANILLYASPKFGKSTFGSQFPNVLFLATEPGLNQIECYKINIRSWENMREAYTLLKKGEHDFKTIVVDTIDNAFQLCARETCDKFDVVHENEVPYGAASGQINNNFYRFLMMLTNLPYTVVLISHEQQKEVEVGGNKIKKAVPSLSIKNSEKVAGLVDVILYGQMVKDASGGDGGYKRVLRTRPCTWHEAGDRTGYLPDQLPLDGSKFVEAYTKGYQAAVAASKHPQATKQQPKRNK